MAPLRAPRFGAEALLRGPLATGGPRPQPLVPEGVAPRGGLRGGAAGVAALVVTGHFALRRVRTRRRAAVTGPGWTDELARIFDPRPAGPEWARSLGYRGRKRIRLLLDGEDIVHSYAKALYERTGKWTGPLTAGLEKALLYGAWAGGAPEPLDVPPGQPVMTPPEILTFVAMPLDLIMAATAGNVCDGYPDATHQSVGRCVKGQRPPGSKNDQDLWINLWLKSLQDENRLITWSRPSRLPGGAPRPNALLTQKYFREGRVVGFHSLGSSPVVLSQVMGAGTTLKVGERVEALKSGRLVQGKWLPSQWQPAEILAANYDGTYDLQFEMKFGPYRERRLKGLKGLPQLSLRKNEIWKDFGADTMPAKFRMMQELNYQQAVTPDKIRLSGALETLSDTVDTEGNQDWYLCSSRQFALTSSSKVKHRHRLDEFSRRFQLGFEWVSTAEGLRFEPTPGATMAAALRANHADVAQQFDIAAQADDVAVRKLEAYKATMAAVEQQVEDIPDIEPAMPSRPAGPRGRGMYSDDSLEPVRIAAS